MNQTTYTKMYIHTPTVNAKGNIYENGETVVRIGTTMKAYGSKDTSKKKSIYTKLIATGALKETEDGKAKFVKDFHFKDVNEAASFLLHRGGDNTSAWRKTEVKKPAVKPVTKQEKKKPVSAQKQGKAKTQAKVTPKQPTKKVETSAKAKLSKRRDPRNPRGIQPQGSDAVKAAQKVTNNVGFVRFAGMAHPVKK